MLEKNTFVTILRCKTRHDNSYQDDLFIVKHFEHGFYRLKPLHGVLRDRMITINEKEFEVAQVSDEFIKTFIPEFERNPFISNQFKKQWRMK